MTALNDPLWYIARDGRNVGPFSTDEFARFEEAGRLRPTDQIWRTGMDAWIEYSNYHASRSATASLVAPDGPASTAKPADKDCVICRFARRAMRSLTNTFMTA